MASMESMNSALFSPVDGLPPEEVIFGSSPVMADLRRNVQKAAGANVPVLLQGQSGTGKEILAKLIHCHSPWGAGPFVKVNCPAIPGTLLESELFGYEKGAFTGAYGVKPGRVEMAHRGTLFLDEIAELDPSLQAKLLQLLQDGQFCRIGAQEEMRVEVRFVCATNRELYKEIEAGTFRQDLFYRINVLTMHLPSLRDRQEDIPMLVDYFLSTFSKKYEITARRLSGGVLDSLQRYRWPGNIRELENVIKRYVILGSESEITQAIGNNGHECLIPEIQADGVTSLKQVVRQAVKQVEKRVILEVLDANRWNRKKTARALRISYSALLYKMREAGVPPTRGRAAQLQAGRDPRTWPDFKPPKECEA
jgi:two-component system response regulator AtoC